MMKKLAALAVALLLLFSLAACSAREDAPPASAAEEPAQTTEQPAVVDGTPVQTGRAPRVTPLSNGEDQVTVMIYVCGSDLESDGGAATADIN